MGLINYSDETGKAMIHSKLTERQQIRYKIHSGQDLHREMEA
jgi:hypothetical protein